MLPTLLISIGMIAMYVIYKWVNSYSEFFQNKGVPFKKPYFFFGNTAGLSFKRYPVSEFVKEIYNSFPTEKIAGVFLFRYPIFLLRDPEVIKQLVVKDFDHFVDHNPFIDDTVDEIFGNSLIFLHGEKWRHMRATLSPAFTGNKIRQMFELVSETADEMAIYFKNKIAIEERVDCEMKDIFTKYTTDVIASTAFGIRVNSFENDRNEFYSAGRNFLHVRSFMSVIKMLIIKAMPTVAKGLKITFLKRDLTDFFKRMVLSNIETREKEKIFRPDLINILMKVRKGNASQTNEQESKEKDSAGFATVEESHIGKTVVNRKWTDNEIVGQCFLFFAAGFDTSSTLLSFVFYELSANPAIEQKLYEEISTTNRRLEGKRISYDVLQQMTYLDMVVSETLRYWPPVPMVDRICVKDYDYNDEKLKFQITKGVVIWIPIYAIHHDANFFSNPSKFDPERFSDANKGSIAPGTYMPFGVGPRNCIGSRLALMAVKAIIYYMMLNFKFESNEHTQIPLRLKKTPLGLQTERGVHLTMKRR